MDRLANRRRVVRRAVVEQLELRRLLAHFAVIGDFSSDNATAPTRDVANLVKSWNPDFVATVGDNNYPDGASSTIDSNIGQWYHAFIGNYKGSFGGGASPNKFFPAIGNHDYSSSGGYSPYLNYFTLPGNERYYTTVQGNVQLFVINSDSHESDGTSQNSTQGQWLKSALAASTAQWKLVLFHHPAYSSGSLGSNSFMQWPFQQWGASAVISGHDHDYERIDKGGFPYFVDGLGGESIVGFGGTVSGSKVRYNNDYGAMLIDTSSSTMTFQFINRSGQVIDSYTLGSNTSAPSAPTGLAASAPSSTQAKLTWTDASPSLSSSFKIERSTDGGATFIPLTTTLAGVTTYTDQGLAPGATYVYRVRASNSNGDSGYSNTASVTLPTGSTTFISDMTWVSSSNGWGPVERDTSVGSNGTGDGKTITLNGVTYAKGLGAHAASQIVINLNKQYGTFLSDIGVDDETGPGTVVFQVLADGVKVFDSGLMTQTSATQSVSIDVSNVMQLTLVVTNGGDNIDYDHADWANARLQSPAPSQPPAAPTKLVAMAVGPTQISLTWQDVLNESGFRIERSIDNVTFAPIATVGQNVVGYSDSTVSGDTLYYYRVIATSASGDSPPSNVDFARPLQPPSPAENLAASAASSTEIDLTWKNPNTNDEMSFKIERSLDGSSGWTQIANVPETEAYSDTTVQPETQYFYRILGSNPAGDSGYSNIANATTLVVVPTAPNAPTGLAASAVSVSQINLTWTDKSTDETGFILERSTDNFVSNVTQIATPVANATSYSDSTGLSPGTQYFYRIRATNGVGPSANSTVASATTLAAPTAPSAPSGLLASAVSTSQINLTWTNTSTNETGFVIERSTDNFVLSVTQIATPVANATSYSDSTGLSPGTKYFYRIRATNGVGPSANSTVASATTLAATALPSPWVDGDIGTTGAAGSGTYTNGVFTVKGSGNDIWSTADAFNFVYQPWMGNGQIIARFTGASSAPSSAFAGIMFRETLTAGSKEASLFNNMNNLLGFCRRTSTGGSTSASTASAATPYWLKLIRNGNSFSAYRSANGTTWTQVGSSVTISMATQIYVGLAVCSTSPGTLATFNFDGVTTSSSTSSSLAGTLTVPASPLVAFSSTPIDASTDSKNPLLDLLA